MDFASVPPSGGLSDGRATAVQSHNHNFMLRVQAAIGPKYLDGQGLQGRVLVAFSISERGELTAVRLAQSSGVDKLDARALQIIGRASFPVPPSGTGVAHRTYVSAFSFG